MVSTKLFALCVTSTAAAAIAAIIYIIVDNTSYCRYGKAKPNTAVSYDDGKVVCLPGYAFVDGQSTHYVSCDKPPNWNWDNVPECLPINEAIGWQCPVQTDDSSMAGEFIIVQPSPASQVYIEGRVVGLNSSTIKSIDVLNSTESCFLTFGEASPSAGQQGAEIAGNEFLISETLSQPLALNEPFQLAIRAIGAKHAVNSKMDKFQGVAVFFIEQNSKTIGVFSAESSAL